MLPLTLLALASAATGPVPIGNPANWISVGDYPRSEISKGITGVSGVALVVDKKGRVADCSVAASSGSVTLDATGCAVLKLRATFSPAKDGRGKAVDGVYTFRIRWVLPSDAAMQLPGKSQSVAIAVDVDAKGFVQSCTTIEGVESLSEGQPTPCLRFPNGTRTRVVADASGKPITYRLIMRQTISVEPRP